MDLSFLGLLGTIAPVFIIIAAGYVLRRREWLTAESDQSLLRLGVNLLYPCLIADTILGNPLLSLPGNLLVPPLVGFGTVLGGLLVSRLVAGMLRLPSPVARSFTFTAGIYNYGYLPIPIVLALYDRNTMGVLFTYNIGVEAALWTVGVGMLASTKERGGWRRCINVPMLAIVFTAAANFAGAGAWLPPFVRTAMHMLGQSAIPLALVLTGATLADLAPSLRLQGQAGALLAANVLRLLILPVLMLLCAAWLPASPELKRIMAIQAAMPSAMIPIILARHYGADASIALAIVLSTTILSLLTIPLWLRLGSAWLGI